MLQVEKMGPFTQVHTKSPRPARIASAGLFQKHPDRKVAMCRDDPTSEPRRLNITDVRERYCMITTRKTSRRHYTLHTSRRLASGRVRRHGSHRKELAPSGHRAIEAVCLLHGNIRRLAHTRARTYHAPSHLRSTRTRDTAGDTGPIKAQALHHQGTKPSVRLRTSAHMAHETLMTPPTQADFMSSVA